MKYIGCSLFSPLISYFSIFYGYAMKVLFVSCYIWIYKIGSKCPKCFCSNPMIDSCYLDPNIFLDHLKQSLPIIATDRVHSCVRWFMSFSPLVAHLLPSSTMNTSQEGEPLLLSINLIFPRGVVTKVCGIWHGKLCRCDINCIATSSFLVGFKVHTTGRSIMFVTVNSHYVWGLHCYFSDKYTSYQSPFQTYLSLPASSSRSQPSSDKLLSVIYGC